MALEAINHAGHLPKTNLLVVLNDNEMSISPNVGAISRHLNKMRLSPPVQFRQPQGTGQADPRVIPVSRARTPQEGMKRLAVPK